MRTGYKERWRRGLNSKTTGGVVVVEVVSIKGMMVLFLCFGYIRE